MSVQPIPSGYHTVTPYLIVKGASAAIEFYKRAFGAVETLRMEMPNGAIGHAEIRIGDSTIMLADEAPDRGAIGPLTLGGSPVNLLLYVADVDARYARAIAAGAIVRNPVATQFYGDRTGCLKDPFGHLWTLATHVEDVSPEQLRERFAAMMKTKG